MSSAVSGRAAVLASLLLAAGVAHAQEGPTMAGVLEASTADDWQVIGQDDLLYLFLEHGVVVFELAPAFAPDHIANIRALAAQHYWDGLAVIRSQDNYVAQWGDPKAGTDDARSLGDVPAGILPEFYRPLDGLDLRSIDSDDAYADEVGFVDGFPVGSDGERAWLAHCYGMLGAGRANEVDSGNGAELYVVTGHAHFRPPPPEHTSPPGWQHRYLGARSALPRVVPA